MFGCGMRVCSEALFCELCMSRVLAYMGDPETRRPRDRRHRPKSEDSRRYSECNGNTTLRLHYRFSQLEFQELTDRDVLGLAIQGTDHHAIRSRLNESHRPLDGDLIFGRLRMPRRSQPLVPGMLLAESVLPRHQRLSQASSATSTPPSRGVKRGFVSPRMARMLPKSHAKPAELSPTRSSLDDYRLLVENVADYAIFMLFPDGRVATWSIGAKKIKGYEPGEIVGEHISKFYASEDLAERKPQRELDIAAEVGRFEDEGWRVRKDGTRFWANVVIAALRDADGRLRGFGKVTRDLTERKRAEENARELVREQAARAASEQAEARLRESEERYRDLSTRLEVILEGVAEGITVQDKTGRVVFANSAAARTCGFGTREEFLAAAPNEVMARFEILGEDGKPFPLEELPGRRALKGLDPATALLHTCDKSNGRDWWSHVRATCVRRGGEPHLAINIWHDVTAQHRQNEALRFLAEASASLTASLDIEESLRTLARTIVPAFADWCTVDLLEGEELQRKAVAHVDAAKIEAAEEWYARYQPDPKAAHGTWNVVRTGKSELYPEITEELLRRGARDEEHLAALRNIGLRSVMIVPIRVRDETLGTMAFVWAESGRHYDAQDLSVAEELGRRAGAALENAKLYAAEKQAREHLALLATAGELFSAAITRDMIVNQVVKVALPTLGDFAFFDVLDDGNVQRVAAAFEDPEALALITSARGVEWTRTDKTLSALSSGRSGMEPDIDGAWMREVARPEHLDLLRRLQLSSVITVPLKSRDGLLGSLTLCFGRSGRHHTPEQLQLTEELARRATLAIEQSRLYAAAQDAARRAEDANRIKDEFLATVSHELRTPLNAIVGWTSILRQRQPDASTAKALEVIHRNCRAQVQIVDDILDVSRIINGKFRLDLKPADLLTLASEAMEVVRPSATAKEIHLELTAPKEPCLLVVDPERLQQVIWNLLANALKFTDRSGKVAVDVRRHGASVELSVSDTGRGIEAEFLPFVFERFKQADSSTTRRFGGLGLGLALVRHIVELHGGHVSAASAGPGKGASFTITLPVRALSPAISSAEHRPRSRTEHSPGPVPAVRGIRVLVVDDDADARDLLREVLSRSEAAVETAGSAATALDALPRFRPDILIVDIGMPIVDGYTLMERIRLLTPDRGGSTRSIALTAYTRAEDRARALAAGYTTHIAKPVNPDDLLAAVANLAAISRE